MLIFEWERQPDDPAFDAMLHRLRSLVAAMEAVHAGRRPTDMPDDAPLLDRWVLAQRPVACLVGQSSGHPLLTGSARAIATSDLWLMSADQKWARTLSRWYRLGDRDPIGRTDKWQQ